MRGGDLMARIRSIHPGLFTDESFVSCSPLARLLVLGLWTEADDQGVFEWKPVTLKMRVLPVDGADVSALLNEIAEQNIIRRFEVDGKVYGAVRNFRKYQRPKAPNKIHPLPDHLRSYVAISEIEGDKPGRFPPKEEIAAQMEDGGEGKEEGEKEDTASAASSARAPAFDWVEIERQCCEAAASDALGSFDPIRELIDSRKADVEGLVLPTIRSRRGKNVASWRYYVPVLAEALLKAAPSSPSQGPPKVFVVKDTPEWAYRVAAGHKPGMTTQHPETKADGWYFAAETPDTWNKGERAA